jgi:hypothetical protein
MLLLGLLRLLDLTVGYWTDKHFRKRCMRLIDALLSISADFRSRQIVFVPFQIFPS